MRKPPPGFRPPWQPSQSTFKWASTIGNPIRLWLATLAVTLILFFYTWFIARVALEVRPMVAVGIVMLDFVVSTIVLLFADSMLL